MAALLTLLWLTPPLTQPTSIADGADAFADAFFDDSAVREIRLTFDDQDWYNKLVASHQNANATGDPYFPCKFQYGDLVIPQIGARFKGNSSFRRNGTKRPFKLDFNEYDENATFLGMKKLNLNTNDLSPDFLREKLLLDFAGRFAASLRAVHVRLYVNDQYYGLYTAIEQPDKPMMKDRFGDKEDGNLFEAGERLGAGGGGSPNLTYLGSNPASYYNIYELETNEEARDYSGLIDFLDVLNNTPSAELPARLEPICDVENWLTGMALNNLFVNLDSYIGVGAEYYLYDRTSDGRFIHVQWDQNESFGTTGDGTPRIANPFTMDVFWLPTGGGGPGGGNTARPLLTRLWAVPEYRRLYLRIFARMLREGFNNEAFDPRIKQLADMIRPHVYEDPNKVTTNAQFETALETQVSGGGGGPGGGLVYYGLKQFIRERYNHLRPYLNSQALPNDVRLNELVAVNNGSYRDEAGDADPWVELHNLGPGPVTTDGFYLTDDQANPTKWALPSKTLADGEFLVLWLDGEPGEGEAHVNFKLEASGGKLYLYSNQTAIDNVSYPALASGRSYIRLGLYGDRWSVTVQPTPATANSAVSAPTQGTGQLLINEIVADNRRSFEDPNEPGAYEDWFEVYNPGATDVNMSGMYITDNLSNPTKWKVPDGVMIPARGRLVFIADDNETAQGPLHTSFSLNADGESLAIYESNGTTLIDLVTFAVQQEDVSFGRVTDGATSWSIFKPATPGAANTAAYVNWITSGASFLLAPIAPHSISSAFGQSLAAGTVVASSTPLPTTLGGVTVSITDIAGVTRNAPLFFVSAGQVNFQVPAETASGRARVTVRRQDGSTLTGDLLVDSVAPGLFAANANGQGVGAMVALRVDSAGAQTYLPVFNYNTSQQRFVAVPVSLGAETDKLFLILFGTGIRSATNLSAVTVEVGGVEAPVAFAGAQGDLVGLDQVNIGPLPRALVGKGSVEVVIRVNGRRANRVTVTIQ
jgi:uncharacterized protein (TIGR03437 family)